MRNVVQIFFEYWQAWGHDDLPRELVTVLGHLLISAQTSEELCENLNRCCFEYNMVVKRFHGSGLGENTERNNAPVGMLHFYLFSKHFSM